jgi:hypothetical protein
MGQNVFVTVLIGSRIASSFLVSAWGLFGHRPDSHVFIPQTLRADLA